MSNFYFASNYVTQVISELLIKLQEQQQLLLFIDWSLTKRGEVSCLYSGLDLIYFIGRAIGPNEATFLQTLTNLAFPFTDKALEAIHKFRDLGTDYVQVSWLFCVVLVFQAKATVLTLFECY